MNIVKYILNKVRNPYYSTSKWYNEGMIQIYNDYNNQIQEGIEKDELSVHSVWGYLRHIPREKVNIGYSKEVYSIANKCINTLFLYSLRRAYIPAEMTIEDFMYTDWYHTSWNTHNFL